MWKVGITCPVPPYMKHMELSKDDDHNDGDDDDGDDDGDDDYDDSGC